CRAAYPGHHSHSAFPKHAVDDQDGYRSSGGAVLIGWCVLAALPAWLQHERCRVGRPDCPGGIRCRNRCCHAFVSGSRLGQTPSCRPHFITRSGGGDSRRRGPTYSAEDHDCLRDSLWLAANHVVASDPNRNGCDEAHCHPDDRWGDHVGPARVAALSRYLLALATAQSEDDYCTVRRVKRRKSRL